VAIALLPIVYLVYNMIYAAFAIPTGKWSDRIGRRKVLIAGFLFYAVTLAGFAFFATKTSMWILFALYGLYMALTNGVARAYVSDLVAERNRGTALGAYHALIGITVLPANLIGGFLWKYINPSAPFIFGIVLSIVAAFLLANVVKNR